MLPLSILRSFFRRHVRHGGVDRACRLSHDFQQALLGEVTPNLRSLTFSCDSDHIRCRFIFDGPVSCDDEVRVTFVDGVVSTKSYDDGWWGTFNTETLRLDYPLDPLNFSLDTWVYRRFEPPLAESEAAQARKVLPENWELIADAGTANAMSCELQREIGNSRHVLHGTAAHAIARSVSCDDILFTLNDGRVAVVHLTYRTQPETDPMWPFAHVFGSVAAFTKAAARH